MNKIFNSRVAPSVSIDILIANGRTEIGHKTTLNVGDKNVIQKKQIFDYIVYMKYRA